MNDEMFVLIEASKLSMDDEFMQYQPNNDSEKKFKDLLEDVIKKGIADFWRPRMDPTLDEVENICFKAGEKPAVGKSYNWWRENAKRFNPKRKSRLGTKAQYVAFLGVLIKTLVTDGWTVDEAWDAVYNNSEKLGHYWNSENAKCDFEPTGSRAIAGFYDLANTYKVLEEDEKTDGYWCVGGSYYDWSDSLPLADLSYHSRRLDYHDYGVGWIVLKC